MMITKSWFSSFDQGSKINTPVTHTCNPSYLGGWDWEDQGSRPDK
jgi:hypothetical protein